MVTRTPIWGVWVANPHGQQDPPAMGTPGAAIGLLQGSPTSAGPMGVGPGLGRGGGHGDTPSPSSLAAAAGGCAALQCAQLRCASPLLVALLL